MTPLLRFPRSRVLLVARRRGLGAVRRRWCDLGLGRWYPALDLQQLEGEEQARREMRREFQESPGAVGGCRVVEDDHSRRWVGEVLGHTQELAVDDAEVGK